MSEPSNQLIPVLQAVFDAQEGKLDDNGVQRLKSLVRGALGTRANVSRVTKAIEEEDWYLLEGELRRKMSELDASAKSSSVRAQASSEANATSSVNISAVLKAQETISVTNELDAKQKKELVRLLQEAFEAAEENKPKAVGQKLRDFLEAAANTATLAQVIGPVLLQLGQALAR